MDLNESVCGHIGVITNARVIGDIMGPPTVLGLGLGPPTVLGLGLGSGSGAGLGLGLGFRPALMEYAVLPVGVDMMRPSACWVETRVMVRYKG